MLELLEDDPSTYKLVYFYADVSDANMSKVKELSRQIDASVAKVYRINGQANELPDWLRLQLPYMGLLRSTSDHYVLYEGNYSYDSVVKFVADKRYDIV